ncbi:lon protease like peroxisomal [Diplodia corticola]|uniref:Lon protease like peroxisomal n=1 Tax=Diplodia corticola TaxID=236234 RepID=A0A1J9QVR9_9PEZI|nr:lon protease like peroxisomal [Diplodia corticola]OJD33086.1 lon protease like peroxisomal [Diplodia corticola]
MEAAGLAVGIVPLVIEAIKSYKAARKLIKTYRRCSEEIDKFYFQFEIQQTNFENECDLLLLDDDDSLRILLSGGREDQRLVENYENCAGILKHIAHALSEVHREMQCFKILKKERLKKDEPLRDTFRRVCKKTEFTFRKPELEKQLRGLKDLNGELSLVRSYIDEFRSRQTKRPGYLNVPQQAPRQYAMVRHAAGTLHRALMTSWGCDMSNHAGHEAMLCLDAEPHANERVSLDMAISFQDVSNATQTVPYWLQIQSSVSTKKSDDSLHVEGNLLNVHLNNLLRPNRKRSRDSSESAAEEAPLSRRVIQNSSFSSNETCTVTHASPVQMPVTPSALVDLAKTNDICRLIGETLCNSSLQSNSLRCLGYLKVEEECQHLFYCSGPSAKGGRPVARPLHANSSSMAKVLSSMPHNEVRPDQQINIAHRLAVSLLQYNSTPWLDDVWRTQDVFVLGDSPDLSNAVLSTLHFKTSMPDKMVADQAVQAADSTIQDTATTAATSADPADDQLSLYHGVRNVPLFSLGVALLEISQQKPILFQDGEDQIVAVRRMAKQSMRLGPRYGEIVRRCLECDFGQGNDLEKSELQSAVHQEVVCPLEALMKQLRLD